MFPKIADWDAFVVRVSLICNLIIGTTTGIYKKIHLVSMDEKTGIQAISRVEVPMSEGKNQRREHEYERHGTTTLIGAFDVKEGHLVHHHLGPTRNEQDMLKFCQDTQLLYPKEDEVIFIADQLNTHKSASLVEWVAKEMDFEGDLGEKGKRGILKSMPSRMAFLETETHRIRFVYTPKHCSWLNPIENWFGKLQRHVVTRGNYSSVEEINSKIRDYIEYYNQCMVVPLKWKFEGFTKGKILADAIMVKT